MVRRIVTTIIAAIVLGIASSIAVSWMAGYAVELQDDYWGEGFTTHPHPAENWDFKIWKASGAVRISGSVQIWHDKMDAESFQALPGVSMLVLPGWSRFSSPPAQIGFYERTFEADEIRSEVFIEEARGYPMPCMLWMQRGRIDQSGRFKDGELQWAIVLEEPDENGWVKALPIRPIWTGLAINTAFYASAILVFGLGPWAVLRILRTRRRLNQRRCAQCGYDLSRNDMLGCPECGWMRKR